MIQAMLTVAEKVAILFLMMAVGYICSKKRIITSRGAIQMTNVLFYVVTPCLVISSFVTAKGITMGNVAVAALVSIGGMLLTIGATFLTFRREKDKSRKNLLRFAVAYSNCGFMGFPLCQAVLGDVGIVYASACCLGFNLLVWTHGYSIIGGGSHHDSILKKLLLNPGTISFLVGLPLFAFQVPIPNVILDPMTSLGDMNTPLAMLVVGTYVAKVPFKEFFRDKDVYVTTFYRLLVMPLLYFAFVCLVNPNPEIFVSSVILLAGPTAANTVMFSAMFGNDIKLSCKTVAATTLFSIFTMPLFTTLAQQFTGMI